VRIQVLTMKHKTILLMFVLLIIPASFAHLDAGGDKVINNYLIDFGYAPENPKVSDKLTLAFNLINDTTKEVIEPSNVWIRISSSKEVVFAGTFHPEAQHIAFSYKFPYADEYEITARFKDDKGIIIETDFKIKIEGFNIGLIFIIAVLFIIGLMIIKKK